MLKQKTVDIEDSNIAGYGGEEHREGRREAAKSEAAWKGVGEKPGIRIWRAEKFEMVKWPKEQYGKFYEGDSYIILRTYLKSPDSKKLSFDVHFWLGAKSSQDEQGTVAYKTVELDDLLNDEPVQHREVQGHESDMFKSYFKPAIQIMKGGVDSGFNVAKPREYQTRLFLVKGFRTASVSQCDEVSASQLNDGDVFILDTGTMIYQWNGAQSAPNEKRKGQETVTAMRGERHGRAKSQVVESGDEDDDFWEAIGGKGTIKTAEEGGSDKAAVKAATAPRKEMWQLSDASGSLEFKQIATGKLNKNDLDSNDSFIVDSGTEVFVWIGNGATKNEKREAMQAAIDYCRSHDRPSWIPITKLKEGQESASFKAVFK